MKPHRYIIYAIAIDYFNAPTWSWYVLWVVLGISLINWLIETGLNYSKKMNRDKQMKVVK